ncbi:hypothetical protein F5Y19DRAFT_411898 [Xylariaceae sp. FL1651]|nr:hypothetical protein F5Y19DRAFT_411898 [Xylariaceae sp. FL1651]
MAEWIVNRLIVCVDESEYAEDGTLGHSNVSNLFRLKSLVATGATTVDSQNRCVNQTVQYYQAATDGGQWRGLSNRSSGPVDQQIKHIVEDICRRSEGPQVEVFFYGSGRGAYVIQAVASLLHYIGRPKSMSDFDQLYQKALEFNKAFRTDDNLNGTKLMTYLKAHCNEPPKIRFLGAFDTLKSPVEKYEYEPSFVGSIQHFRHALAFNDTQTTPHMMEIPRDEGMDGRSFIQAWFMGNHQDICGGSEQDGLSLFPLQWMLLESMAAGLIFQPDSRNEILSITFPQFAGGLPTLEADEKAQWRLKYTNGIEVSMFDLQSVHGDTKDESDHSVRVNTGSGRRNHRKVFDSDKTLLGWLAKKPYGNIIHPSMFAMLDRNSRYYDKGVFKSKKKELVGFQERCLDDQGKLQPWLEGLALKASGVKAFRILVCGKTGVGKSTLINKVFGVEMTEESTTYAQGVHDINKAFESPDHPGLLIHDSRGWQAGSDSELDLIAKFLRHRAFQKNPAESLHVIWFCVDSDVSRIEEADKRTFQTIAQYSSHVPVFVVGTKKDKLVAFRKMQVLEQYMEKTGDYREASRLATLEANEAADKQFMVLQDQLSNLEHYKADGYCCISKDDDDGVRQLLSETLDLITDDRVRVFCVAAQVVDVEQKIDQAITEVMRLSIHAIRTAMVPLPASGLIGTPTVSRILCEHVLQCFGFPKATPEAVEEIMSNVVMGNLRSFMKVSLAHFGAVSVATIATAVPTAGIGAVLGIAGCILSAPPTARMLLKCACDMILILERAFRYQGKYISVKQLEDAAVYYTTTMTKTFSGKDTLLQTHVHDQVDRLIPLKKVNVGFKFGTLREGLQEIIYLNRYDKSEDSKLLSRNNSSQLSILRDWKGAPSTDTQGSTLSSNNLRHLKDTPLAEAQRSGPVSNTWRDWKGTSTGPPYEAPIATPPVVELDSKTIGRLPAELEGMSIRDPVVISELEGDSRLPEQTHPEYMSSADSAQSPAWSFADTLSSPATTVSSSNMDAMSVGSADRSGELKKAKSRSSGNLFKKSMGRLGFKKS